MYRLSELLLSTSEHKLQRIFMNVLQLGYAETRETFGKYSVGLQI